MKGKLYAAALAAIALAACSQDEELTSAKQNNSVSPIAFNVTFGEEPGTSTRAEFGGTNGYTLMWTAEDKDKMSLFHGMTDPSGNIDIKDVAIAGVQNAVYEAQSGQDEEEGALLFTTQSMVLPGCAIMVYPVDTVFNYTGDGSVYIRIPENQTEASWKQVPFMSEGLLIAGYDGGKGDGAGYGKDYEIGMKQVGTLFTLKTEWANDDKVKALADAGEIDPINVTSVALNRPTDKFNTKVQVKLTNKKPNYADEVDSRDAWKYVSVVDYLDASVAASQVNTLTTSAVTGLETSEFVLLPQKEETTVHTDATVKIYTRYGSVTIDNTNKTMWKKGEEDSKVKVADMLNQIVGLTLNMNTSGKYANEMVGGHATRYIDADLSKLDMSDVHIKDDKWLHDIILVHDAYQEGQKVVLTIDGGEDGVFEMSMNTVKMLQERPEIGLKACNVSGEACKTIRLMGGGEIPAIDFLEDGIGGPNVSVELAANETPWTWTGKVRELHKVDLLTNYGVINIAETATVGFTNVSHGFGGIVNEGTINVNGGVTTLIGSTGNASTLYVVNNGDITIAEGAELHSGQGCVLTNESTTATDMATIENSGIIGCTGNGVINNYGLIENMVGGTENMVLVTSNQTKNADFAKLYGNNNKYGTILMKSAADNISVSTATDQGFIKYVYTEETYKKTEPCRYNYLIVENHDITFAGEAPELLFLEIQGTTTMPVIRATKEFKSLKGFIVNGRANLQEGNTLITPAAYIQGTFYYGGVFTEDGNSKDTPSTNPTYYGPSSTNCLVKTN